MHARVVWVLAGAVWIGGHVATAGALPPFRTTPAVSNPAPTAQATLTGISVGTRPGFDRIVFRFRGATPGYRVAYVPRIIQDGSGFVLAVRGRRFLSIVMQPTVNGTSANAPRTITPLFPTLRQLRRSGDFEGVLSYGAGLSSRVGFRVFTLPNPRRVVVDVRN